MLHHHVVCMFKNDLCISKTPVALEGTLHHAKVLTLVSCVEISSEVSGTLQDRLSYVWTNTPAGSVTV